MLQILFLIVCTTAYEFCNVVVDLYCFGQDLDLDSVGKMTSETE
jgi:hypothetical protein